MLTPLLSTGTQTYKLETFALMDRPTKICVVSSGEEGANRDKDRLIYQWIGRVDLFEDLFSCVVPESARILPPPPPSKTTTTTTGAENGGTSISSSQQTATPKPKSAVPVLDNPAIVAEGDESEESEEEEEDEEESEDEEEDDRNLCQSVSMEVGVTFVSWAITSYVSSLPVAPLPPSRPRARPSLLVFRSTLTRSSLPIMRLPVVSPSSPPSLPRNSTPIQTRCAKGWS